MLNKSFKKFKFHHLKKNNQVLYYSINTNGKYEVEVFENTLDRIKNNFK